jgi:hypothetical protein
MKIEQFISFSRAMNFAILSRRSVERLAVQRRRPSRLVDSSTAGAARRPPFI